MKALTEQPDDGPNSIFGPHNGKKEPTSKSCPLDSTCHGMCPHTQTHKNTNVKIIPKDDATKQSKLLK